MKWTISILILLLPQMVFSASESLTFSFSQSQGTVGYNYIGRVEAAEGYDTFFTKHVGTKYFAVIDDQGPLHLLHSTTHNRPLPPGLWKPAHYSSGSSMTLGTIQYCNLLDLGSKWTGTLPDLNILTATCTVFCYESCPLC